MVKFLLVVGVLVLGAPFLWAQSCSLEMPCSSCANTGNWSCACPANVPGGGVVVACCCQSPSGGLCAQTCGGCCTQWRTATEPFVYTTVCQSRSCQGGVNCSWFNCIGGGGRAAAPKVAMRAAEAPGAQAIEQQQGEAVGETAAAPAEWLAVRVDPDGEGGVPVELEDPRVAVRGKVVEGMRLKVRNGQTKPLVAVALALRMETADGAVSESTVMADFFLGRAQLEGGEAREMNLEFREVFRAPVTEARVAAVFAHYADGTSSGSVRAVALPGMLARWRESFTLYGQVGNALREGSVAEREARVRQILEGARAASEPCCPDAVSILTDALAAGGLEAVRRLVEGVPPPSRR